MRNFLLATTVLAFSAGAKAQSYIGIGIEGGSVSTDSDTRSEVDKDGTVIGGYLGYSKFLTPTQRFNAQLGYQQFKIDGSSSLGKQEIDTSLALLNLAYHYSFGLFEAGLAARLNAGDTASLKAADEDKAKSSLAIGPELAFRWQREAGDIVAQLGAYRSLNIKDQKVTSVVLGLSYWLKISEETATSSSASPSIAPPEDSKSEVPSSSNQAAVEGPIPQQEPAVPEIHDRRILQILKGKHPQFETASGKMKKDAASRLKVLTEKLTAISDSIKGIEIRAHSDGNTKNEANNRKISELRAVAVQKAFTNAGFPTDKISARGFGAQEPLAGKDSKDPENRRIEIVIDPIGESKDLEHALEAYDSLN